MNVIDIAHPTVPLMSSETPLLPLKRLSAELGIDLWIKRDDLGEIGGGGNKLRKLQYVLGAAKKQGNDVLLTAGSVQSNHCRLTAAVAASCDIECHLILTLPFDDPDLSYLQSGNRALFDLFGAQSMTLRPGQDSMPALEQRSEELKALGRNPMIIPIGASTPLGCLGYVDAAKEIANQLAKATRGSFDLTICGSGSGGMQAGLVVGNACYSFSEKIVGMSVGRSQVDQKKVVSRLVKDTRSLLGLDPSGEGIEVSDVARGPGYGRIGNDAIQALSLAARFDGLLLDPVYTAKAFAGLLAMVANGSISKSSRVLFVHSGGSPALFAYPKATSKGVRHAT